MSEIPSWSKALSQLVEFAHSGTDSFYRLCKDNYFLPCTVSAHQTHRVAAQSEKIELFYLPDCSSDLNLEEQLNADLNQETGKRVPLRTKANICAANSEHVAILKQIPERIIGYFQALCRLTLQGPGSAVKIAKTYLFNAAVNYGGDQQPLQSCCPA